MGIFDFDFSPFFKNWLNWVFTNRLIIGLVISALIAAIASLLTDNTQKITYFSILLVLAVVFGSFLYLRSFILEVIRNNNHEIIAKELTILNCRKLILIDESTKKEGCVIVEYREIQNNMNEVYHQFLMENSNDIEAQQFSDFHFKKNGKPCRFTPEEARFLPSKECDVTTPETEAWHTFQLWLPLRIPAHEVCSFEMKYRTKAFAAALDNKLDYVQVTSNTVGEKLELNVKLVGDMKKLYCLEFPREMRPSGEPYEIEILDTSSQRMWTSETQLLKDNVRPKFNTWHTGMRWVIHHPKMGYVYRMYFTVIPKSPADDS